jgi:hypothetical protein
MPSTEMTVSRWVRRPHYAGQTEPVVSSDRAVLLAARLSQPSLREGVKAKPLRGRCASLDTAATVRGVAAIEEEGED